MIFLIFSVILWIGVKIERIQNIYTIYTHKSQIQFTTISSWMILVTNLHSGVFCQNVRILNRTGMGRLFDVLPRVAIDSEVLLEAPLDEMYNSGWDEIFSNAVDITESSSRTAVYSSRVCVSRLDSSVKAFSFSGFGVNVLVLISCW